MVLLVRFGELALKSRFVRRQLRDRLVANIQDLFAAEGVECITEADEARVYVHVEDIAKPLAILGRVFGVVSISPATEVHSDLDSLRKAVLSEASRALSPGQSFALRPRRVGTHPFTSQDLARELGEAVRQAHPDVRVNLTQPDVEIHVEVRRNRGFVFQEIWPGPGGLPLGSQGRALAVVQDEAGMVAAWMGMKRGCRIAVATSDGEGLVEPLRKWDVWTNWSGSREPKRSSSGPVGKSSRRKTGRRSTSPHSNRSSGSATRKSCAWRPESDPREVTCRVARGG